MSDADKPFATPRSDAEDEPPVPFSRRVITAVACFATSWAVIAGAMYVGPPDWLVVAIAGVGTGLVARAFDRDRDGPTLAIAGTAALVPFVLLSGLIITVGDGALRGGGTVAIEGIIAGALAIAFAKLGASFTRYAGGAGFGTAALEEVARREWIGRVDCPKCASIQTECETWDGRRERPASFVCNACNHRWPHAA